MMTVPPALVWCCCSTGRSPAFDLWYLRTPSGGVSSSARRIALFWCLRTPSGCASRYFFRLISVIFSRFFCLYLLFCSRIVSGCFLRYLLFCSRKISECFSRYLFLCYRCFRLISINPMRDVQIRWSCENRKQKWLPSFIPSLFPPKRLMGKNKIGWGRGYSPYHYFWGSCNFLVIICLIQKTTSTLPIMQNNWISLLGFVFVFYSFLSRKVRQPISLLHLGQNCKKFTLSNYSWE